jgi:hypothetical protein
MGEPIGNTLNDNLLRKPARSTTQQPRHPDHRPRPARSRGRDPAAGISASSATNYRPKRFGIAVNLLSALLGTGGGLDGVLAGPIDPRLIRCRLKRLKCEH